MDEQQILIRIIESGWAQCATVLQEDRGVLATALIAGLVGSATHCVGMCGPFVISQVTARMEKLPLAKMNEFRRLTGAALLPYQFGRLTTYTLLGVLAGFFADSITVLTKVWWLGPVLLLCAAAFFLVFGIMGLVPHLGGLFPNLAMADGVVGGKAGQWWSRVIGDRIKPLFGAPFGWRGYVLGVMLGFIPCGLIYGALVLAAASGDALSGSFVMAAFGLGTVPMLFATGVIGQYAAKRFRSFMAPVGRGLMVANAVILAVLAFHQIG
ncbi:sulfite exporter TauE/SafE family protein [Thalassospira alkalitolerans]|uniref:sulfite exporter TauE/SafE family protein n=1 Tax=Thalassospira alkalitolerans TaxID=1293890 RepID=UPI003AA8E157